MPTEQMFWGQMKYGDGSRVPLLAYKCKAHLQRLAGVTQIPTAHKCKSVVDHEGDHVCICGKKWAQTRREKRA